MFEKVINSGNTEYFENTDCSVLNSIYPVFDENNRVFAVLQSTSLTKQLTEERLINGILKVYGNYLNLLDKAQKDKLTGLFNRETLDQKIVEILREPYKPLKLQALSISCNKENLYSDLASSDVIVEYIIDAAIGNHIQQADAAVVGADRILADGSVVNKCGTSLLALAAQYYKKPLYVIADGSKCVKYGADNLSLEEMPITELGAPCSPYIYPHNFYFDVTDAALIDKYITECGAEANWPWSKNTHF